jgi:hypothetical protein
MTLTGGRRNAARRLLKSWSRGIEIAAAVATIAALGVGLANHLADHSAKPENQREGKRIIAFRQLANRICSEGRQNERRAMDVGRTRSERLGFVARAVGWSVNDLEGVTAPPAREEPFFAEIALRRATERWVLGLQVALEHGGAKRRTDAVASLESMEDRSRELAVETGISRCHPVVPPPQQLLRR